MSNIPTPVYVDAPGWSNAVTVTQTYNYTSPDGTITITGTAAFTYTRLKLATLAANPKLPSSSLLFFGGDSTALNNKFLAVSYAVGFTPGWLVFFGPQDTQPGAFTRTYTPPGGGTPTQTALDADCELSAGCTLIAPGYRQGSRDNRTLLYPLNQSLLGYNVGVVDGDPVDPSSFSVTLIQPGIAADPAKKQAAIPPVYRVSLPTDANLLSKFSLVVNGRESSGVPTPYIGTGLAGFIQGAFQDLGYTFNGATMEPISPWACDVQMLNVSDTLAAGKLSYDKTKPADSALTVSPGGTKTITNPFPMTGQSFTLGPDANGLTVQVQF